MLCWVKTQPTANPRESLPACEVYRRVKNLTTHFCRIYKREENVILYLEVGWVLTQQTISSLTG